MKRKQNAKIILYKELIDKIANSEQLKEQEKLAFLKIIGYLTKNERDELELII